MRQARVTSSLSNTALHKPPSSSSSMERNPIFSMTGGPRRAGEALHDAGSVNGSGHHTFESQTYPTASWQRKRRPPTAACSTSRVNHCLERKERALVAKKASSRGFEGRTWGGADNKINDYASTQLHYGAHPGPTPTHPHPHNKQREVAQGIGGCPITSLLQADGQLATQ